MNGRVVDKLGRQQLLAQLLEDRRVRSQADALRLLAEHGVGTTQATVSRDLDDLGAVKVRDPDGGLVYRLPVLPTARSARDQLDETLQRFVTSVTSSGNLAILRTPPAGAQPVASAIDLAELPGIVATMAGDDTVLVVAEDGLPGAEVAQRIRGILDPRHPTTITETR